MQVMRFRCTLHSFLLYLAVGLGLLSGCATVEPIFENSNQILLEKTVNELDIAQSVASVVPKGGVVALVSVERPGTPDHPIIATIEDQLIRSLLAGGFGVVERDDDLLEKLVAERSGDTYRLIYLPSEIQISSAGAATALPLRSMGYGGWLGGEYGVTEISGVRPDTLLVFDTQLRSADYLISYRVLECGIIYRKGSIGMTKRESMVRLHLRVQDARSGNVLLAENLSGKLEDEVEKGSVQDLADYHYSFYSNDLPLERGAQAGHRQFSAQKSQSASAARSMLAIVGAALVAVFAVQAAAD